MFCQSKNNAEIVFKPTSQILNFDLFLEGASKNSEEKGLKWLADTLGLDCADISDLSLFHELNRATFSEMSLIDKVNLLSGFFDLDDLTLEESGRLYDTLEFIKDHILMTEMCKEKV